MRRVASAAEPRISSWNVCVASLDSAMMPERHDEPRDERHRQLDEREAGSRRRAAAPAVIGPGSP